MEFSISVIIPNYNHAPYLPECLESILLQSCPANEVIVIDDASTDNSLSVLQALKKKHPTLQVIKNSHNLGNHASVNRGIQRAKGLFMYFIAADDVVLPDFFSACKNAFETFPDMGVCCGDCATFRTGQPHQNYCILPVKTPMRLEPQALCKVMRRHQFLISSNAAICRRDLVISQGGFNKELKSIADAYLYYYSAFQSELVYVPQIFSSFRIVENSYGATVRKNIRVRLRMWDSFFKEFSKQENSNFRKNAIRSRLLGIGGYFMLLYLFFHPKYWMLFPSVFDNVVRRKFNEFLRSLKNRSA